MKPLQAFITKEFKHILRDRKTLLITLVMPIVLVILFGFAIKTEIRNAPIAIYDPANDALSIGLINKLESSGYFVPTKRINQISQMDEVFNDGTIKLVILFPPDFSSQFYHDKKTSIQLVADASNLNTATVLLSYASAIIQEYQSMLLPEGKQPPFQLTTKMEYNREMKDVYMFVPGVLALILMIVSAMMTASSLSKEKESGTLRLLIVSPLSTPTIIIGKVIPYLILSIINCLVILILSVWILDMPIVGNIYSLLFVCLIFLFTAMSLGVLISSIAPTQQIAIFLSIIGLFLPTTLLSGFIYPIENMPLPLQTFCQIVPARWFIEAIKGIMIKGSSLQEVIIPISVLLAMTILFIRISIFRYSKKAI